MSLDANSAKPNLFKSDMPAEADGFRRLPFAERVADQIASRSDTSSLAIGIYGAWGDGKTTVLDFIKKRLTSKEYAERVVVMPFNPWLFTDEAHLVRTFFDTLASCMNASLKGTKQDFGEAIQKSSWDVSASWTRENAKKAGEQMAAFSLDDAKKRIEELLSASKKRVVIFMDDIDRLDKSEIQAVFKLVKLAANFKHTTYVLAFDDEMVAAALNEKYGAGNAESKQANIKAGRGFLEKIIQVPLHLPKISDTTLLEFCLENIQQTVKDVGIEITPAQWAEFTASFASAFSGLLKTPRMCKRYANAAGFALAILKDEVNPVDLMLLEALRVFYSSIYQGIRDSKSVFLGTQEVVFDSIKSSLERYTDMMGEVLSGLLPSERAAMINLLRNLFPGSRTQQYGYTKSRYAN